jgi:hypothetical protein
MLRPFAAACQFQIALPAEDGDGASRCCFGACGNSIFGCYSHPCTPLAMSPSEPLQTDSRIFAFTGWDIIRFWRAAQLRLLLRDVLPFPRLPLWVMLLLSFIFSVKSSGHDSASRLTLPR